MGFEKDCIVYNIMDLILYGNGILLDKFKFIEIIKY